MVAAAETLAARVQRWQRSHGRHGLPWQGTRDPYRVWLSEVMLQQTQVGTVLAYYDHFLQRFPDVQALAAAPQDDVLALWSGLGYYSRARNLHRCAQAVVALHGGRFPRSSEDLTTLPGIGRSTAAAIAAFCFGERVAILDGNVKRVLSRALGFGEDLASGPAVQRLWQRAQDLLPEKGVDVYTQGLMDLGATVCTLRKPRCDACPLQADCVAYRQGQPLAYPVKTRKLKRGRRHNALLMLQRGDRVLLVQRPQTGVWAGLWSLPEFADGSGLMSLVGAWPGSGGWLPTVEHVLTHFDWTLKPLHWQLPTDLPPAPPTPSPDAAQAQVQVQALHGGRWVLLEEALAMGLPAPVRRLLETNLTGPG